MNKLLKTNTMIFCLLTLVACGGQKINKHVKNKPAHKALITAQDEHLRVAVQDIWIKNDPASWVKNATWDEYVISVHPKEQTIKIKEITLTDRFGAAVAPNFNRKLLKKDSKLIKQKYEEAGYDIHIGNDVNGRLLGLTGAVGIGAAVGSTASTAYVGSAAAGAAGAVVVAIPAAITSGIVRAVNHSKVQKVLSQKNLSWPVHIAVSFSGSQLNVIFPAVPIPQQLKITYEVNNQIKNIKLPLSQLMPNTHLALN